MQIKSSLTAIILIISLNVAVSHATEAPIEPTMDDATIERLVEAAIIKKAIQLMQENIKASGRESGEIDKLVRALSGVSVKDIEKYGICGGKNSEVRKLFGSMCNKIK